MERRVLVLRTAPLDGPFAAAVSQQLAACLAPRPAGGELGREPD
jgi:hypothetical protein